jgi:hypothetical protein
MSLTRLISIVMVLIAALLLAGCNVLDEVTPPPVDPGAVHTQAAATVFAELTQTALAPVDANAVRTQVAQTVAAELTQNAPTATFTPTNTDIPTATPTPTITPAPTNTPPPPTNTPQLTPCDAAKFIADINVPDGTIIPINARFNKTWRIQNVGLCTWTRDYSLVFTSGDRMGAPNFIALNTNVRPGETIDLSVELIAPNRAGNYRGYWMLANDEGDLFGIGDKNDKPFWVLVKVAEPQTDYVYDFVFSVCEADWESDAEDDLPCPGRSGDSRGYVVPLDRPSLENGRVENEPGLLTVPNSNADGYIEGRFRNLRIRDGYRFRSGVMCAQDSRGCDVIFSVSYRISGSQRVELGAWRETFDGQYNIVDIDLSFLEGETIDLFLTVEANDSNRNNNAIWWLPHIEDVD